MQNYLRVYNAKVRSSYDLVYKSYSRKMSFVCKQTFKDSNSKFRCFYRKCFAMQWIEML